MKLDSQQAPEAQQSAGLLPVSNAAQMDCSTPAAAAAAAGADDGQCDGPALQQAPGVVQVDCQQQQQQQQQQKAATKQQQQQQQQQEAATKQRPDSAAEPASAKHYNCYSSSPGSKELDVLLRQAAEAGAAEGRRVRRPVARLNL
jgi:hypothetical protein